MKSIKLKSCCLPSPHPSCKQWHPALSCVPPFSQAQSSQSAPMLGSRKDGIADDSHRNRLWIPASNLYGPQLLVFQMGVTMAPAAALHKCSEERGLDTCRTLILASANSDNLCMSCYCQKYKTCLKHLPGVKQELGVVYIFYLSCRNTRGIH